MPSLTFAPLTIYAPPTMTGPATHRTPAHASACHIIVIAT
jgi:hypothetical protein